MDPIVHGIKEKYSQCMQMEQVNYHQHTPWHDLIYPLAAPEFALLDSSNEVLHRWFGVTDEEEFSAVIDPLCN
jgi:hypothetical protein